MISKLVAPAREWASWSRWRSFFGLKRFGRPGWRRCFKSLVFLSWEIQWYNVLTGNLVILWSSFTFCVLLFYNDLTNSRCFLSINFGCIMMSYWLCRLGCVQFFDIYRSMLWGKHINKNWFVLSNDLWQDLHLNHVIVTATFFRHYCTYYKCFLNTFLKCVWKLF